MGEYSGSVARLSAGFFFLFAAFNTVQTLESSVLADKSLAFATLSTIYGMFSLTNIAAPKIVSILGPRLGMFVGSLCYISLTAANLYPGWYTLLPTSAAVGVGAAVLWTSQGIYLSRCASREAASTGEKVDDVLGRLNGMFWAVFQFNGALGLAIVGVIFQILPSESQQKAVSPPGCLEWRVLIFLRVFLFLFLTIYPFPAPIVLVTPRFLTTCFWDSPLRGASALP